MPISLLDRALAMFGLCRHQRLDTCHAVADRLAIAERHANIAQMRNRAILRALPDLLFIHSAEGRFLDYYARDRRQLLLPPERFLGRSIDEVLPPDLAASFGSVFRQAASADGPVVHHYSLEVQGTVRHYEARVVRCDDGTFLSIVRDQSARRDAELQLAAAHRGLTRQWQLMGLASVASTMARDLNQPLTAILANAQTALRLLNRDGHSLVEVRAALSDVLADSRRAAGAIVEASNLFSVGSNEAVPVAINDIIQAAYATAGIHLEHVRATVRFDLAQNLPAVVGERLQLQQVVLQLMMNAADALSDLPAASPRLLTVSSRAHESSVFVSIADTGAGVEESLVERLFEPLFTTKPDGVGMGLTASRAIIDAHGGSLWATRNGSSGAVFTFSLPASAP
jgi:C4-dicarboxylate-specific signal transduction histidine kinase